MMGLFGAGSHKKSQSRSTADTDGNPDDTEILDENEGSIIVHLISQLRIGMDLSRVTFPTFVLEPRSMLERITDFMAHPHLIFGAETVDDPEERFIRVLQYYLAGWHIKPKGVKKPFNPILGEFFRCRYDYSNGTRGFYIAEQVSHHPPISAYYYISPANKLQIVGELRPKSKFLGNSVSTVLEGENRVYLMGKPNDGEYVITMPNMYARGILFGKMILELGDTCQAQCVANDIVADLDFKTKGFFSGTYNAVNGKVRSKGHDIGDIHGRWSHIMEYRESKSEEKRILFDAHGPDAVVAEKCVEPIENQEPNESRRLWQKLTEAIKVHDMEGATDAKSAVEGAQRDLRRAREEKGESFTPRFFVSQDGRWVPKIGALPDDTQEAIKLIENFIWQAPL